MNLKENFYELFNYDKYYKMSNEELKHEANKYGLQRIYNPISLDIERTEVIKQLIDKDNATMFKRSLIVSFITLICVIISLIVSIIAIFIK